MHSEGVLSGGGGGRAGGGVLVVLPEAPECNSGVTGMYTYRDYKREGDTGNHIILRY